MARLEPLPYKAHVRAEERCAEQPKRVVREPRPWHKEAAEGGDAEGRGQPEGEHLRSNKKQSEAIRSQPEGEHLRRNKKDSDGTSRTSKDIEGSRRISKNIGCCFGQKASSRGRATWRPVARCVRRARPSRGMPAADRVPWRVERRRH